VVNSALMMDALMDMWLTQGC